MLHIWSCKTLAYDQTVLQRLIKGFNAHIIFVIIIKPSITMEHHAP